MNGVKNNKKKIRYSKQFILGQFRQRENTCIDAPLKGDTKVGKQNLSVGRKEPT